MSAQPCQLSMAGQVGTCKSIVFMITTQKWLVTNWLWNQEITRKHELTNYIWSLQQSTPLIRFHIRFQWGICVCAKMIPAHMYIYCYLSRTSRWHHMGFTLIRHWNCPCEAIVLPHIGITWGLHGSTHETAHVKSRSCHTLGSYGVYPGRPIKLRM